MLRCPSRFLARSVPVALIALLLCTAGPLNGYALWHLWDSSLQF
jgi:hypothetical protein